MKIEINHQSINMPAGISILDACKSVNINIPTLCYLEDLFPSGSCRMCVVEIAGMKNLVTSCSTQITEGMKIFTHSNRVIAARKSILELLLSNHPDDCLYCDKNNSCELQKLSAELGVRNRNFSKHSIEKEIDKSSPSLVRDPSKCILCGRCVRVCEERQTVSAISFIKRGSQTKVTTAFDGGLNTSNCINCGQCAMVCPTGAIVEKNNIKDVLAALSDPDKVVVVQHAPAISVTLGELFGFKPGSDVNGQMTAALRKMGFQFVFETSFSADVTIMEEASELVERIKKGDKLPLMTSCSPGWIKFIEHFYPEFLNNLSTCKSPQQMMGALIKSYWAKKKNIDSKNIYSVSIMPCTAKKFEAGRAEMITGGFADIDAVLTTREFAKMIDMFNINLAKLKPENADDPLGKHSSAAKLFGVTGGVAEAALRTAAFLITNDDSKVQEIREYRDLEGIKELTLNINGITLKTVVVSGLANARQVLDDIKRGIKQYHFIEVMTCPGGCIAGGGQPFGLDKNRIISRMKALYQIDKNEKIRKSHHNKDVAALYEEFLMHPLSKQSHELLHTSYKARTGY